MRFGAGKSAHASSASAPSRSASIPIVHSEPRIKVSEKEANDIGKRDLHNLVKNKKLVLLVDLDHTLIHTTNEQVSDQLKVCIRKKNTHTNT